VQAIALRAAATRLDLELDADPAVVGTEAKLDVARAAARPDASHLVPRIIVR
jgi:hypothetical protein